MPSIWCKATLSIRTSLSSLSSPQWIGLLPNGLLRASPRWDIPASHQPFLPYLQAEYDKATIEYLSDPRYNPAEPHFPPHMQICFEHKSLGFLADERMTEILDSIPYGERNWITPERKDLWNTLRSLTLAEILPLTEAIAEARVPLVITGQGGFDFTR